MDTMHLNDPFVLLRYEGSFSIYALSLPLFLLSLRIVMPCHCSSIMTKDHILVTFSGTKWPLCAYMPLNLIHSFPCHFHWCPIILTVVLFSKLVTCDGFQVNRILLTQDNMFVGYISKTYRRKTVWYITLTGMINVRFPVCQGVGVHRIAAVN